MEFRFRYLGPEASEVEVSSLEQLRGLVHDGTVGEVTLLYDALTREWAPARAHAVYRFIRDEAARPAVEAPPAAGSRSGAGGDDLGLGMALSLKELPNAPDADEAVRDLLRERAEDSEPAARTEASLLAWKSPVKAATEAPAVTAPSATHRVEPAAPPALALVAMTPEPATNAPARPAPFEFSSPIPQIAPHSRPPAEMPVFRAVGVEPAQPPLSIEAAAGSLRITAWFDDVGRALIRSVGPRALPRTLVLGGLVGLALLLVSTVRRDDAVAAQSTEQQAAMSVAPDVGRLVNRFASAEESGFENLVSGVDSLRDLHGIAKTPSIWLEGSYLADAHRYPEVKDFWARYQTFLRDVQANDTALFRAGFMRSLEQQGMGGAVLSLRLTQALREFEKSQPRRDDVYRHMQDLSTAALELHELLVDRAADITYEPALQKDRVSREPVVEAVAEDVLLKDHMWTLLERIFASLEWMGGNVGGSRDNLTERLVEGIQAAHAR